MNREEIKKKKEGGREGKREVMREGEEKKRRGKK